MASVIDVKTLSKEEIVGLIKELLKEKIITNEFLSELADQNSQDDTFDDLAYIESLIDKHFEEYDEVFRKLA